MFLCHPLPPQPPPMPPPSPCPPRHTVVKISTRPATVNSAVARAAAAAADLLHHDQLHRHTIAISATVTHSYISGIGTGPVRPRTADVDNAANSEIKIKLARTYSAYTPHPTSIYRRADGWRAVDWEIAGGPPSKTIIVSPSLGLCVIAACALQLSAFSGCTVSWKKSRGF